MRFMGVIAMAQLARLADVQARGHGRVDEARADGVHANVVGGELHGQDLGHHPDARLGDAVGADADLRHLRHDRGDVDDGATVAGLDHAAGDGAVREHDAVEVDVEHALPGADRLVHEEHGGGVGGDIGRGAGVADARGRDEDVDRAERLDGGVREGFARGLVAGVGRDEDGLASALLDGGDGVRAVLQVADDDVGALVGVKLGGGSADAAGPTGNDRHLALELAHLKPPCAGMAGL